METIHVRIATIGDLDELVRFRILMQSEVHGLDPNLADDNYIKKVREYFISHIPNKKYLGIVAEKDSKIIGSSGICFYQKPPSISGGTGLFGYVTNVFTAPDHRCQGVGSRMIQKIIEVANEMGADKVHLGATEDGIGMYQRCGFKEPRLMYLEVKPNILPGTNF